MVKKSRAKMPISQRAKQFAPFAALKGFEEAIAQKQKIYLRKPDLSEEMAQKLDDDIKKTKKGEKITVTYYYDGEFFDVSGIVKNLDLIYKTIAIDNNIIPIEDIFKISF